MAGYSGTPLGKKLGIKSGHRVMALDPPPHLGELLPELPDDVRMYETAIKGSTSPAPPKTQDVVLLFCRDLASLITGLPQARPLIDWDGALWVCWPKKSSRLASDLSGDEVRSHGLAEGLVDNKVCAVDEDWSGLRFVYRRVDRPSR